MPQFYEIDKQRRLVLSTRSGTFSRADVPRPREKLLKDLKDPDLDSAA